MKYYGGIDLGGTNSKIGLIDENGNLVSKISVKTDEAQGFENTVARLSNVLIDLIRQNNINVDDLVSVGVGIPGPVVNRKIVKMFSNFSWPSNLNVAQEFEKNLNVPVFVDNDVNVITLGEVYAGSAKGFSDVVCLAIGTGIGAGVVVNGKLISGKSGSAGEIGHIVLQKDGTLCGCGHKGCFEGYASATGIIREAKSRLMVNKDSKLKYLDNIEAKDVFEAAKNNDMLSIDIIEDISDKLAMGIGNVLNILDSQAIIIGGGVSLAGDYLFDKIKEKLPKYALAPTLDGLVIEKASLGNDAGIYGASYLAKLEN